MNIHERFGMNDRLAFNYFKDIYEHQLHEQSNCELAFKQSLKYFSNNYGYEPYENLDHYLKELFEHLKGIQLFK